jgi:hypothetical protein
MRKIEREMIQAIVDKRGWHKSNTAVMYSDSRQVSCVYLHNNLIAVVDKDTVQVYDGGWQSNTTKSRLNALINELCDGRMFGVYQRDFSWYIQDGVTHQPFDHGHTFPRI